MRRPLPPSLLLAALCSPAAIAQELPPTDWAFQPLRVVESATVEPATVAPADWNGNPIDRAIYAGLQRNGLEPSPPADRRTLIRRASFALTGLPPTPAEVDAFVADPSPAAFATVVDRLLASPHYGEHQARAWLDLARYSDSNGLDENLAFANAFRYRDWVVQAHNQDLPYDRFLQLQIAGDLLAEQPDVGMDGHVATGFLALGPRMLAEQDKEKLVLDTVDEQLDLVGRTFLGLTLGCARCHDHKFDPISQRDYYALAGIFRSAKSFHELGHVSTWFDRELATEAEIKTRKAAEQRLERATAELAERTQQAIAAQRDRLVADVGRYLLAGEQLLARGAFVEAEAARETSLRADAEHWGSADTTVLHTYQGGAQFAAWSVTVASGGKHRLLVRYAAAESRPMRLSIDGVAQAEPVLAAVTGGWLPANQQWHPAGEFELAPGEHTLRLDAIDPHTVHLDALLLLPVAVDAPGDLLPPVLQQVAAVLAQRRSDPIVAFWRELVDGPAEQFGARAAAMQGKGGLSAILLGGLPPANPTELAARLQTFFASAAAAARGMAPGAGKAKKGKPEDAAKIALADPLLEAARALLLDRDGLSAAPDELLRPWLPAAIAAELNGLEQAREALAKAVPKPAPQAICVAEDTVRDLPVHYRGNHLTLAPDAVPRGVPAVFASFVPAPALPGDRSGRLELARWMVAAEQPLAARVHANRLWQRAFGQGLVRSPSNFGRRGDVPNHRDLLDLLATAMRTDGWSQKQFWRRLLLTRTWQQSVPLAGAAHERDPDNRWHGRMQRQRLPAEAIRDAMLQVGGNLDRTLGGTLLGTGDRGYVTNDQSGDAANYDSPRRSLYLPIIRNAMFDLFTAFDYADPSVHIEQRPQTAVAPQALYLLNAPFVREQARAFAARVVAAADGDDERITFAFREAFARTPSPSERAATHAWLQRATASGEADRAWPGLCQALFASTEFAYLD
jgi:hypothetical protein